MTTGNNRDNLMARFSDMLKSDKKRILIYVGVIALAFLIGWVIPSPLQEWFGSVHSNPFDIVQVDTIYPDGSHYVGGMVGDKRTGDGVYKRRNETFSGEWNNDRLKYGERSNKYSYYRGEFDDDLRLDGFGIIEYTDYYISKKRQEGRQDAEIVKSYVGNWRRGMKEGLGRCHKLDGSLDFGYYREAVLQKPDGQSFTHGDKVYGIDVSHYQSDIDWDYLAIYCDENGKAYRHRPKGKTYMQPVFFAIMKASEGGSIQDDVYSVRMKEAKRHGLVRGSYHFFHFDSPAERQVDNFLEVAQWTEGDLPPVLDVESDKEVEACGVEVAKDMMLTWLQTVEDRLGVRPIIYTRERFKEKYLDDSRFSKYDFWIARYGKTPEVDWLMWQLSDKGLIKGHEGYIDLNIYNGNYQSFENYLNNLKR